MISPIITRRRGLSVAQPQPLMKLAMASCQTSRVAVQATTDSQADVTAIRPTMPAWVRRRSNRSVKGPEKGPEQAHGEQAEHGNLGDEEGRAGLLVDDDPLATVSSHRTVETIMPTYHRRQ